MVKKMPNMSHTSRSYLHGARTRLGWRPNRDSRCGGTDGWDRSSPCRRRIDVSDGLHRRDLVYEDLHTDAAVVPHAQQVVHHLEALRPLGEVHRGHIGYHLVLSKYACW